MGRQKLTDEEREQRREARLEKARKKRAEAAKRRELEKAAIRSEIAGLASVIPPHARDGAVNTVRAWKDVLDAATHAAQLHASSVDRLVAARDALKAAVNA